MNDPLRDDNRAAREESVREAQAAGWRESEKPEPFLPEVRLWAYDLVALVEAMRTQFGPGSRS